MKNYGKKSTIGVEKRHVMRGGKNNYQKGGGGINIFLFRTKI
jgi:hypothetical protein